MADFSNPKYASYIQLCRELRLERGLIYGDWYFSEKGMLRINVVPFDSLGDADRNLVWLPSLADWIAKLRELGVPEIHIEYLTDPDEIGVASMGHLANAATEEEAFARLWQAILSDPRLLNPTPAKRRTGWLGLRCYR